MGADFWGAVIRVAICLPVVVLLAYLFIKYGFSKTYTRRKGNMEIVEQVALLPKASLNIVKIGDEYLLLGATEHEIKLIKQLEDYKEMEPVEFQFQFHLNDAIKKISRESKRHGKNG